MTDEPEQNEAPTPLTVTYVDFPAGHAPGLPVQFRLKCLEPLFCSAALLPLSLPNSGFVG